MFPSWSREHRVGGKEGSSQFPALPVSPGAACTGRGPTRGEVPGALRPCPLLPIPPAAYPAGVYKCWKLRAGPKFPPRQQLLCEFYTQAPRDPGAMEELPLNGESTGAAGGTRPQTHPHRIPPSSSPQGIFINLLSMLTIPFPHLIPAGMWELWVPQHVLGAIPEPRSPLLVHSDSPRPRSRWEISLQ